MRTVSTVDGAHYTQRTHTATTNSGKPLTEFRVIEHFQDWALLHPAQAEPVVGLPWLVAHLHGQWVLTAPVTAIAGRL